MMNRIKLYLKFPSKAPYAWFVYKLIGSTLSRVQAFIVYYFDPNMGTWLSLPIFLIGALVVLLSNIQIVVNIVRVIKKQESLTTKKLIISILLLLGIFTVFNPLSNMLLHTITNNRPLIYKFSI